MDGVDAALRGARQGLADAKVVQQSAEALFGPGLDTIVDVQLARRGCMSARFDDETKRLRALSLAQLADEADAAKSQTEAIKAGSDPAVTQS